MTAGGTSLWRHSSGFLFSRKRRVVLAIAGGVLPAISEMGQGDKGEGDKGQGETGQDQKGEARGDGPASDNHLQQGRPSAKDGSGKVEPCLTGKENPMAEAFGEERGELAGTRRIGRAIRRVGTWLAGISLAMGVGAVEAEEVNLYSSRHYDTDERLYTEFTEQTGIRINRLEDRADVLLERIKAEGRNSPADILITTDAGRLWAAVEAGLLQTVETETLSTRIPAALRHPEGLWFGFSKRARVIFYAKDRVDPSSVTTYADLAKPAFKGQVCTRSSGNIYMLSLMASIIANRGEDAAKAWAAGVWANRPRDPRGGDVVQLRGIVSGECDYAIGNTYYFARAMRRDMAGLKHPEQTSKIGVIFPNQETTGTHVNISGAGVLKTAPNRDNAIRFLDYLTSDRAQKYFAEGNDEYPVVEGVALSAQVLSLGSFKEDDLNLSVLGENQALAQRLYDEAGFK